MAITTEDLLMAMHTKITKNNNRRFIKLSWYQFLKIVFENMKFISNDGSQLT